MACGPAGEGLPVRRGCPQSPACHRTGRAPGTGFLCFLFAGQRARSLGTLPGWLLLPSGGSGHCRVMSGLVPFHPHYPSYPTSSSLLLHLTPAFLVREAAHCQWSRRVSSHHCPHWPEEEPGLPPGLQGFPQAAAVRGGCGHPWGWQIPPGPAHPGGRWCHSAGRGTALEKGWFSRICTYEEPASPLIKSSVRTGRVTGTLTA